MVAAAGAEMKTGVPRCLYRAKTRRMTLWVPNRSSMSSNLGVFVDQSADPVPASEAKTGGDATWGSGLSGAA